MSKEDFEQFHRMVLRDSSLQEHLRGIEWRDELIAAVIETGKQKGFDFTAEDVEDAFRENQRRWIERWF